MPKATRLSRQVAHFEDGELWCTADTTPPVSPGGWYFRLHDTPVGWIGPFPTAEAATVAPQGGDPLATARRRLEEWARATAEPGAEPPEEADPAPTPTPSSSPLRSNADRNIAFGGEPDGTRPTARPPRRRRRCREACPRCFCRKGPCRANCRLARQYTVSPIASGAPSRVPDPLSPQADQVAARGTGRQFGGHATAGGSLVGTPAAGVRLQSEHRSGSLGSKLCAAAWRAGTSVQTAQRQIGRTGEAAVPEGPGGLAKGE